MNLIDLLVESMMDGKAFKAFTDAVVSNAPSNVKIKEDESTNILEKDICNIMTLTNSDIDPDENNPNFGNDDINEIINLITNKIKSGKHDESIIKQVKKQLNDIKKEMKNLSSDNDVINTNLRQIQNLICK